jgi:predicted RNA-binding Zn-ribbon protein involved in translation (DUF1610 family)
MGLFDRVLVACPQCGESIEFQSKAGDCWLADYTVETMPVSIAADLDGEVERCRTCGQRVRIETEITVTATVVAVPADEAST